MPVLVGVGVSNAVQAVEASTVADGVVMGAAVVRRMIEGGADAVGSFVGGVRTALDGGR
jgi:tryptophan synthase alpha chain